MKTYKIHLIRHGLTEANEKGQYVGASDIPITTDGIMELDALRTTYAYPDVRLFYVSPLTRCVETLKILYPEAKAIAVPELREMHFGVFEGKTAYELQGDPDYQAWTSGQIAAPPGGESTAELTARVAEGFSAVARHLMSSGEREAVVITHGGIIMNLLSACALPQQPAAFWRCDPGCGYTVRITPSVFLRSGVVEVVGPVPEIERTRQ
ncbi:MAG: histidine phosphatase family protein [Candidatus Howiella sp.]